MTKLTHYRQTVQIVQVRLQSAKALRQMHGNPVSFSCGEMLVAFYEIFWLWPVEDGLKSPVFLLRRDINH
jgi:hypothetical protein